MSPMLQWMDANVAVSFPFLSSMRAENVSKMVQLVGGCLPNGAIAPLSWSESVSAPLQNLVHLYSKNWCISIQKSGASPQQSRVSFQKSDHLSLPKKVHHHQDSLSVPQESAKNPSFHTCSHLATIGILQYVDCPDLSHACWALTILAWWYLPSFFLQDSFQVSLFGRDLLSWWLQVSCKN